MKLTISILAALLLAPLAALHAEKPPQPAEINTVADDPHHHRA